MTTGYKDWAVPINISGQELDSIINRPKYGAAVSLFFTKLITTEDTSTIFSISGKGMIYGGWLDANGVGIHSDDAPEFYIDGALVQELSFNDMLSGHVVVPSISPYVLLRYDQVGFKYTVGAVYGYTFESGIVMKYVNVNGSNVSVGGLIYYALTP